MPKYAIQWKDPDRSNMMLVDGKWIDVDTWCDLPEDEQRKLMELGEEEYLTVTFDTDAMTATVKGRNR